MGFGEGLLKEKAEKFSLSIYVFLSLSLKHTCTLWVLGTEKLLSWYRSHQGFRLHMDGNPLLEAGPYAGMCPSLGSSFWDTVI